mmetsp:Transcript_2808/g.6721  ORF Transcript_2808/g.6721 Transcript_2808/m.6721 type:complete len:97 (+) Transcript_2808:1567-1857(+)
MAQRTMRMLDPQTFHWRLPRWLRRTHQMMKMVTSFLHGPSEQNECRFQQVIKKHQASCGRNGLQQWILSGAFSLPLAQTACVPFGMVPEHHVIPED